MTSAPCQLTCEHSGTPGNRGTSVAVGTFLSETKSLRGSEFVRRIQALGKERRVDVRWMAHRGQGEPRTSLLRLEHDNRAQPDG